MVETTDGVKVGIAVRNLAKKYTSGRLSSVKGKQSNDVNTM